MPLSRFVLRGFGFVHHSIAILYHEVPNPNLTIRNFFIAVSQVVGGSEADLELLSLVQQHVRYTRSEVGQRLLADWAVARTQFKVVMPTEYQAVMVKRKAEAAAAVALAKEAAAAIKAVRTLFKPN